MWNRKTIEDYYNDILVKRPHWKILNFVLDSNKGMCKNKVVYINTECGHISTEKLEAIGRNDRCFYCKHIKLGLITSKDEQHYINKIKNNNPDWEIIEFIGKPTNISAGKVKVLCTICDYEHTMFVDNACKYNCPNCTKNNIRTLFSKPDSYHINKIESKVDVTVNKLVYDKDELKCKCKVDYNCNKCNTRYVKNMHTVLYSKCCPKCSPKIPSKGEKRIKKWFDKNSILYEMEKTFDDLNDVSKLRYDFYLPDYNIICEFHGEQHYVFVPHFHRNYEKMNNRRNKDRLKKEYALNNGYIFLEISYKEYDLIEEILNNTINSL